MDSSSDPVGVPRPGSRVSRSGSTPCLRPPASSRRRARGAIVILLAVGLVAGCSKATILKKDCFTVEARIIRNDAEYIYIEQRSGAVAPVARADIKDIDHPGNVLASVATPLMAIGLTFHAVGAGINLEDRRDGGGDGWNILWSVFSVPIYGASLPFAIWGWSDWGTSKGATGPGGKYEIVAPAIATGLAAVHMAALIAESALIMSHCRELGVENSDDGYCEGMQIGDSELRLGHYGLFFEMPLAVWSTVYAIWTWVRFKRSMVRKHQKHKGPASEAGLWDLDSSPIRFLGIAPLVDSDREVKGLTLGFQF